MFDVKKSKFFQSLDPIVQESIMQCGIEFRDEEELMQFARQQKQ